MATRIDDTEEHGEPVDRDHARDGLVVADVADLRPLLGQEERGDRDTDDRDQERRVEDPARSPHERSEQDDRDRGARERDDGRNREPVDRRCRDVRDREQTHLSSSRDFDRSGAAFPGPDSSLCRALGVFGSR